MTRCLIWLALFTASTVSIAGPGAHGPNGEHLGAPASQAVAQASVPRLEASSETFELVGRLQADEFSVVVDRFETNEPVMNANVEAQVGDVKAVAQFHADHGDYSFNDPALLKILSEPGQHPVILTVMAGQESDILEGTLTTAPAAVAADAHNDHDHDHDDGHAHGLEWEGPAIIIVAFLLLTLLGWLLRRRTSSKG